MRGSALRVVSQELSNEKILRGGKNAPLGAGALPRTAVLNDRDYGVQWAGAEYRYEINIGNLSDRFSLSAKAEMRAWEQEFVQAFTDTLGRVAAE